MYSQSKCIWWWAKLQLCDKVVHHSALNLPVPYNVMGRIFILISTATLNVVAPVGPCIIPESWVCPWVDGLISGWDHRGFVQRQRLVKGPYNIWKLEEKVVELAGV